MTVAKTTKTKAASGLTLRLTPPEALALRNVCRVYEKFVPIHRKVGPEEERLAIKLRETIDADPSIVASASAEA
jgi:hypothetical protein